MVTWNAQISPTLTQAGMIYKPYVTFDYILLPLFQLTIVLFLSLIVSMTHSLIYMYFFHTSYRTWPTHLPPFWMQLNANRLCCNSWILTNPQKTTHLTIHTVYTVHNTQGTLYTAHRVHCTQHTGTLYTTHRVHCTQHTGYTVHNTQGTLYTAHRVHCTQHTGYTVHNTQVHCTQHTGYTVHNTQGTLYTAHRVHCTQHTGYTVHNTQGTLYRIHCT